MNVIHMETKTYIVFETVSNQRYTIKLMIDNVH